MKNISLIVLLIQLLLISCVEDAKNEKNSGDTKKIEEEKTIVQNLNISLLLDLSDRIDTLKYPNETMAYYQRDVGYIESIADAFLDHLRHKKVRTIDDRIALYFNPEPKNSKINKLSEELKFQLTRKTVTLEKFDEIKAVYTSKPREIYELALADGKYVGSDTWEFFKNKVNDYCINDDYRNILIILTDGYMFHKDNKREEGNRTSYLTPQYIRDKKINTQNWDITLEKGDYGFIPATTNLNNLEVLVLGVNPDKKNPYEEEVIRTYWSNWLEEMGVLKSDIKTAELPSNMNKIINEFIQNE